MSSKTSTVPVSTVPVSTVPVSTVPKVSLCDDHVLSQEFVNPLSHLDNGTCSDIPYYLMDMMYFMKQVEEAEQSSFYGYFYAYGNPIW